MEATLVQVRSNRLVKEVVKEQLWICLYQEVQVTTLWDLYLMRSLCHVFKALSQISFLFQLGELLIFHYFKVVIRFGKLFTPMTSQFWVILPIFEKLNPKVWKHLT